MKRRQIVNPILVFILAQIAWFGLLALWIYWYVTNYIIFAKVGEKVYPKLEFSTSNVPPLVGGIVLLIVLSTGMWLIFSKLNQQIRITRMYDNFIANVTHELKSPLASIQLYLETLESREVPRDRQVEFLHTMRKDAARLNNLINAILEISGLEDRKKILQLDVYDADPLLRALVEEAADQNRLPQEAYTVRGRAPRRIRADRNALRIMINNLFDNAVKYSRGQVRITVTLGCTQTRVFFEIADQGIGIPASQLKTVFRKFRRLDNPQSPSVKGTGLGLYWVRELVRLHRGTVSARSDGLGAGAVFRVELPVYSENRGEADDDAG